MVLSDRAIRRLVEEGRIGIDPYDAALMQPSSLDVRVDRLFRVFRNSRYPYIDVKLEQEELTELVEVAADEAVHPPPGRVRARVDARAREAPGRPRRAPRGEVEPRAARAADPLDGGLHRPRLRRARDARALERREPADHDLPVDEDRPAVVHAALRAGGDALRLGPARLEVPGPARARPRAATGRTSSTRRDPRHGRQRLRRPSRHTRPRRERRARARARADAPAPQRRSRTSTASSSAAT